MDLVFKPVESDRDYIEQLELRNKTFTWAPMTLEEARARDIANQNRRTKRFIARDSAGRLLSRTSYFEETSSIGCVFFVDSIYMEPARWSDGIRFIETQVAELGAQYTTTWARSTHVHELDQATSLGYETMQRNPMSFLNLMEFDPQGFESELSQVEQQGVEIVPLRVFIDRTGEGWQRDLWRLEMDVCHDIPSPVPFQEWSFEDYKGHLDDPHYDIDSRYIAIVDCRLAGLTEFHISAADHTQALTYLTGVRREYRRRGLALALKVKALAEAKRRGAQRISTDNEENNPMYALNLKLGFKREWDWVILRKKL